MEKKYTQFGTLSVIIMLPLFLLFFYMLIKSVWSSDDDFYIHLLLTLIFLFSLLSFYKLSIIIDDNYVSFKLGIGLIRKRYHISEINSCKPVRNSILFGIGIRLIPNGWLYNFSGFKAIELQFKNRKSIVRIGTDKPEDICNVIHSRLLKENNEVFTRSKTKNWSYPLLILIILITMAVMIVPSIQKTGVQFSNREFKIKGIYGLTIPYSDLTRVDTVSKLPNISLRTNGYAFGRTRIGNFKLEDGSIVKLFVKKEFAPYVLITSKDNRAIYINYEDKSETISLYEELKSKIEQY